MYVDFTFSSDLYEVLALRITSYPPTGILLRSTHLSIYICLFIKAFSSDLYEVLALRITSYPPTGELTIYSAKELCQVMRPRRWIPLQI